jgi:aspartyl-tRNA(Asn)/glutamyl-tRNA(Gln) amidotransferase subunit C
MAITIEEVNRIASLARLEFTDSEKQKLTKELSDILNYVDQLKEIEGKSAAIDDLDPLALNLIRDDVVAEPADPQEFLSQAPGREGKYLKVKSVIE